MPSDIRNCPVHKHEMPCHACAHINLTAPGKGRRQRLREDQPYRPAGYIVTGDVDQKDLERFIKRIGDDPVRLAEMQANARRPFGQDRARWGMALTTNARIPVLTANPESIRLGLDASRSDEYIRKHRPALFQRVASLVVKPTCIKTAKYGRNSPFWGDRLWGMFNLKYAKGFLCVTDLHDYTSTFRTHGELLAAVEQSGWKIVR